MAGDRREPDYGRTYVLVTLALGLIFYGWNHWHVWWLALADGLAWVFAHQPWPGGDDDLVALSYLVRPDVFAGQMGVFALCLVPAAIAAIFIVEYSPIPLRKRSV